VQWGGALTLFDTPTATQVTVRTFGAFDGTNAHPNGEAILQPMLLEAVRAAAAQQGGSVLSLDKEAIARAAQALLASRLQELAAVRVQWSDGQRYPGVVRECRADQVLVGFTNGGMQRIPAQLVSPA
jgi:hypothetical protein